MGVGGREKVSLIFSLIRMDLLVVTGKMGATNGPVLLIRSDKDESGEEEDRGNRE